jgi:hypothetical protein
MAASLPAKRTRLELEPLEDRSLPSAVAAAPAPLPDVQMIGATTTDARTIDVNYTISGAPITGQPLNFNVYRSANPTSLSGAVLLGTASLPASDTTDLAVGQHNGLLLSLQDANGNPVSALTPNPSLPFVLVVANPAGTIVESNPNNNTAWFETFTLGVVSHGLEIDPLGKLPKWEITLANTLQHQDGYQAVIPFNWTKASFLPFPGLAVKAGDRLSKQITTQADQLAAQHPGDVVDVQLIGHSRGGVVVSRAAQDLNGTTDPALRGGFLQMTLLDPHPANNRFGFFSVAPSNSQALDDAIATILFQLVARDPQVVIPSNVQQAELFYQQTPDPNTFSYSSEELLNLWGEPPSNLINQSGRPIHSVNLTGAPAPRGGVVGHSEVHDWYQAHVAATDQTFTFFS